MSHQLPKEFLLSLKDAPGMEWDSFEAAHLQSTQLTSIRINPLKIQDPELLDLPLENSVPWSSTGYYLSHRPSFTLDPLFHAGAYYVQEASSMFLEQALKQTCNLSASLKVLDLCAAPGGKSTLIQSLLSENSLLVSNEVIKSRVHILSENLTKWGALNTVVTNNDPKDFERMAGYFDVMVVDAPCSGSGMFRKDNDAIKEWSTDNVALCSQRQQRILSDALPALKEDGILIYATCSYSTLENEYIADWLLEVHQMESIKIEIDNNAIVESRSQKHGAFGYRFYPNKIKGEGFFLSAFKKIKEKKNTSIQSKNKSKIEQPNNSQKSIVNKWLNPTASVSSFFWEDQLIAVTEFLLQEITFLQKQLYIKKAGTRIGSLAKNDLIPSHELAMSGMANSSLPFVDLNLASALEYLRLNNIDLQECTIGWNLVKYKSISLGWLKKLPNRINNYYPKEWKILYK